MESGHPRVSLLGLRNKLRVSLKGTKWCLNFIWFVPLRLLNKVGVL